MTNNTELVSLHFKQAEKGGSTAWMKCLARAIKDQLGPDRTQTLSQILNYPVLKLQSPETPMIYLWQTNSVNFHKYWDSTHMTRGKNLREH